MSMDNESKTVRNRGPYGGRMDEPRGMTLADLVVLVAGVAVAVGAGWFSLGPEIRVNRERVPEWVGWLAVANEAEWKVLMALVPVVLARRFRYGRGPSAPEFVAVVAGIDWALLMLYRWPALGVVYRDPGSSGSLHVSEAGLNLWMLGLALMAMASAAAIVLARARLSSLAIGLLLALAWQVKGPLNHAANLARDAWLWEVNWLTWGGQILQEVLSLPFGVAARLLPLLGLLAFSAPGRRAATWAEWAILTLALARLAGLQVVNATKIYARAHGPIFWVGLASDILEIALALLLAAAIARRLGPERLWGSRAAGVPEPS